MKRFYEFFTLLGVLLILFIMTVLNYQTKLPIRSHTATISLTQPTLQEAILKGFQKGDVAVLFPYFDELVSICIADKEAIYLAYNAQTVLQTFFDNYPPKRFEIRHSGKSRGGKETYFIGDYMDERDEKLRIYIFVEMNLIQEIEISSRISPS